MKRIRVPFGGGSDTVLLSLRENRFSSYEMDREALHQKYGGRQYYSSRSGLSGEGRLELSPTDDDLVVFGWYRTDAQGQQKRAIVAWKQDSGKPIFGYAPIASHKGIQYDHPVVLTDGKTVAFVSGYEVIDTIRNWTKTTEEADPHSEKLWAFNPIYTSTWEEEVPWNLYNPSHFKGVNALRFVDLRRYRPEKEGEYQLWTIAQKFVQEPPITCQRLNLTRVGNGWIHLDRQLGVLDQLLTTNPLEVEGMVCDGWVGNGHGLVWKRDRWNIQVVLEMKWADLLTAFPDERLDFPGAPAWIDFELELTVYDWYVRSQSEHRDVLLQKIFEKARLEKAHSQPLEVTLKE